MIRIKFSIVYRLFSLICLAFYLLGCLNVYFSDNKDSCAMTFMYEYPQFVRITVPGNDYPQYGLYAYAEGRMTEKARKMKFNGIPVLFLPGNSGSHMQSRSLASVALRKAMSDVYDYHFDYFTVSFNEDLSAFSGGLLFDETIFAIKCIDQILKLYDDNKYTRTVPTQVILIGHSMGGVIAKRLLAYSDTMYSANIAILLASPIQAPVVNYDTHMNQFYHLIEKEWASVNETEGLKSRKMLLSIGNGIRDVLVPSALTASGDADISALTTAIPGVWVSPDHVSIVWCKQLVLAINKFLFSIVDPQTKQVVEDKEIMMAKARQYFVANRSMNLSGEITRPNASMIRDGFWYEDNRRIYQIARPQITKMTYLMIRLVDFPQNRFVAIEGVNVDDKDWIFGCSAHHTHGFHRYCKRATSLTDLSRWTLAAEGFGRRKLATVHLHDIMAREPSWTHVVVKVSPTRKPIVLNVDINDLTSRQIIVRHPILYGITNKRSLIVKQTEPGSLYYELIIPNFDTVHEAFWLYVEPTKECQAKEYHVTAEMLVPWAPNQEVFHHFTQANRSPMKLVLMTTDPGYVWSSRYNDTSVKVTLLLDPQCSFTVSFSYSWYHRLGQFARNYSPMILPYMAAILLLVASGALWEMAVRGRIPSMLSTLASDYCRPMYATGCILSYSAFTHVPGISHFVREFWSSNHAEIGGLKCAWVMMWVYFVTLGLLNVLVAALILAMVFSTQLVNKLFYRIIWGRRTPALVEKAAQGFMAVPVAVGIIASTTATFTCGAVSLAIGGAYYAFVLSNMYQEYTEDYIYQIMAEFAARVGRSFKSKPSATPAPAPAESQEALAIEGNEPPVEVSETEEVKAIESQTGSGDDETERTGVRRRKKPKAGLNAGETSEIETSAEVATGLENKPTAVEEKKKKKTEGEKADKPSRVRIKEDYESSPTTVLHFHMIMFSLWMVVLLVNLPVLITWARNFPYRMKLTPDPSCLVACVLCGCGTRLWSQPSWPFQRLTFYQFVSFMLTSLAVLLLGLGPRALFLVNYGVSIAFLAITAHHEWASVVPLNLYNYGPASDSNDNAENHSNDREQGNATSSGQNAASSEQDTNRSGQGASRSGQESSSSGHSASTSGQDASSSRQNTSSDSGDQSHGGNATCDHSDTGSANKCMYTVFQNLKDKFTLNEDL